MKANPKGCGRKCLCFILRYYKGISQGDRETESGQRFANWNSITRSRRVIITDIRVHIHMYIYIPSFLSLDYQVIRASLSPTYTQLHNATDSLLHTAFLHVRMLSSSSCSKQNHYSLFPHIVGTQTGSSPAGQIGVCLGYCKPTPSSSIQSILFVGHDGNIKTFYAKETGMPLLYLREYESIHLGAEIDSVRVPNVLELMSYTSVR